MQLRNWLPALVLSLSSTLSASATPIPPDPTDGSLQLWFKADSITPANLTGTSVTTWTDSSSYGNSLKVLTTAPTYVAGTPGTLNGEPYVQFSSGAAMVTMANVNAALTGDPNATVFIVLNPQANPNTFNGIFGWGDAQNATGAVGAFTGLRGDSNGLSMEFAGGQPAIFGAGTTTPNAFQVIELQKSSGDINLTSSAYVNGGPELTPQGGSSALPVDVTTSDPHTFALGAFAAQGAADFLNGGVAEVIVYSSVLTAPESANITQYLDDKYFVTPTPEPGSLSLMALGAVALAALARRSRRKACDRA